MYALLITTALAQLLFLWRLRSKPDAAAAVACGVLAAAMLYTHLRSALFLGAEVAMLAGDSWRGNQNIFPAAIRCASCNRPPPAAIRELIACDARAADGAWLISGKSDNEARTELPARCFSVEQRASSYYASLYHVAPLTGASKCR